MRPLIEHLDLVAEPGQTIAIVGPTGAGKTTLANLLLRFYEVDGGRITLDGVDLRDLRREDLRAEFGMVLQDTWLFGGSILANIAYGAAGASASQISEAAQAAYADHFVRTLPEGYDTVIDDEGSSVSAGQRQLLTIARAFLADPAILILDEATSSVDTRTEALVQQAMAALRTGRTSFVIAHRLSTIRDADRIVVMVDGGIVEHGTHAQLLAAGGPYHRLYAAQFSGAVTDEDPRAAPPVGVERAWALAGGLWTADEWWRLGSILHVSNPECAERSRIATRVVAAIAGDGASCVRTRAWPWPRVQGRARRQGSRCSGHRLGASRPSTGPRRRSDVRRVPGRPWSSHPAVTDARSGWRPLVGPGFAPQR